MRWLLGIGCAKQLRGTVVGFASSRNSHARVIAALLAAVALIFASAMRVRADEAADAGDLKSFPVPGGSQLGYFPEPRYIGSVYCYACHLELSLEFAKTKMGKLFQVSPRSDLERRGCEGCHGPGSNHAMLGGGLGMGGLIEFRVDSGQSIEEANRACLDCHDESFWHRKVHSGRTLACFDCHTVMTRTSRHGQLSPPFVADWNNRASWRGAAGVGMVAGIITGLFFNRKRRRRKDQD